ncbi:MAG: hypothetical protein KKD18_02165 [Nanoarchaeota archaeon]|nr:hypothetical protein [Nanoarchaeota archaeon]MBU0977196.1 hypothetical protein [Nanoarchaeota archaeon]
MEKEDLMVVAQLLAAIRDAIDRLEGALRDKDGEALNAAKKEIMTFQKEIRDRL